jgi:D-alanyl-D-alanine carboxypeptidase/D-alanyl-D-alanine-endopeptidase (penicillin-binding protein 4)
MPVRTTQTPPVPRGTPTPDTTATPLAQNLPSPRSLEELRARIQDVMRQPSLASSHLAVKVASLDTGRVLFEENADKWLQPASNLKLYTVAAALDRLTPEYRFNTSVYAPARPDAAGTVRGDLVVYGRGDPTYATRFTGGSDYYTAIDELAARITGAGVRRVEGDLIGDESYFRGGPLAPGWEWDDLQWYYGAEVSALTINDNSVDLSVKPGARVGDPCTITLGPQTTLVTVVDRTVTAPRGTRSDLNVHRPLNENVIEVSGSLPLDDKGYSASIGVSRPAMLFAWMLRASLERRGVSITGRTRTVDARARESAPLQTATLVEIANRQSPPLSVIAAQTLKPSQNLYTELLLRTLGRTVGTDPKQTSDEAGIEAIKVFLRNAGLNADKVLISDGSGLSRSDLVTVETTLQLLTYMSRHRYASVYRDALPVAGIDGTLRSRMRNTVAQGNARAKTGTLSSATSLSGYVTSASGERLVFSLMINNPPREISAPRTFTDPITVLLASFTGRS